MTVPAVPTRSLQRMAARSCCRSRRSHPLKGGNVGTLTLHCRNLVPMPGFLCIRETDRPTVLFSLREKFRGMV